MPPGDTAGNRPAEAAGAAGAAGAAAVECLWYVAHTRARCEKKVAEASRRLGAETTLPVFRSVKKYRGKTLVFEKPLFPGYVFLRMPVSLRLPVQQNDQVANLLNVPDQDEFKEQLEGILLALDSDYEIRLLPALTPGTQVRIKSGPLRGLEAYVENRRGLVEVQLRLEFIGQGAAVRMDADMLEPI